MNNPQIDRDKMSDVSITGLNAVAVPVIPFGPEGVPRNVRDAKYYHQAARNIRYHASRGNSFAGSNLTESVAKLCDAAADALESVTAPTKPPVHNHGPAEGRGLDCNESVVGGCLQGACMRVTEQTDPFSQSPHMAAKYWAELVRARKRIAELEASALTEAALSDTDDELARWLHMRFGKNQSKNWNQLSQRLRNAWRDMAGDAPSRASQPVQIEVTDEMVEKAARVIYNEATALQVNAWDGEDPGEKKFWLNHARAALEAALGGGE